MGLFGLSGKNAKLVSMLLLLVVTLFVMVFVSQTVGLGKGGFGFDTIKTQHFFYIGPGLAAALIILIITVVELYIRKGDIFFGNGLGFSSVGEEPHYKSSMFDNPMRLALASLIIFSTLGLVASYNQQTFLTFTGIGTLQQQFTKFDNAIFSGALVATSENLQAAAIIVLTIFGLRAYARKRKLSRKDFRYTAWILVPIIMGTFGVINHLSRYANQDVAITTVFVFWALGGFITVMSGSFIPFWIAHIINNAFYDISAALGSKETVVIYIIVFIILLSALFIYLYFIRKRKEQT